METTIMGLGFRGMLGLYRDNGKNGNYYLGIREYLDNKRYEISWRAPRLL